MSHNKSGVQQIVSSVSNSGNNRPVFQEIIEGGKAVSVFFGTGEISRNRSLSGASNIYTRAKNGVTWEKEDNVKQFYITCFDNSGIVLTDFSKKDYVLMTIDNEFEATALLALTNTGGQKVDVNYHVIPYGEKTLFQGVDYFSFLDFLPTIENTRIIVEAQ